MILRDVPRVSTPRGSSSSKKTSHPGCVQTASFAEVNSGPADIAQTGNSLEKQPTIPPDWDLATLLLYMRPAGNCHACYQTFVDRDSTAIRVLPNFDRACCMFESVRVRIVFKRHAARPSGLGSRAVVATHPRPLTPGARRGCRSRWSSAGRPGRSKRPFAARSTALPRPAWRLETSKNKAQGGLDYRCLSVDFVVCMDL